MTSRYRLWIASLATVCLTTDVHACCPSTATLSSYTSLISSYGYNSSSSDVVSYAEARIERLTVFPLFVILVVYMAFYVGYALFGEVRGRTLVTVAPLRLTHSYPSALWCW